jgi:trimethylamine---corrinoid protein Co-methyltransferase
VIFAQVASAPNCSDAERGRRPGTQQDFRDLVRLAQSFNVIHATGGYPVEPVDLHASVRHLDCLSDLAKLTDKAFHCYSLGRPRNRDALEIARIARGISNEQLEREPSLYTVINSSSPLRLDAPMLQGIMEMAARNQVVIMTPFTLAGAMAPVTVAGALAQQNAEALAGIAFTQIVRPGAPVVYGGFTSNVDMKTGAPAFGTPEYMKSAMVGGQLARRYRLPYRTSNTCAANTVDAQAAYESVFSLWGAVMGGGNFLLHSAGWMEGGLTASFEKTVLDVDLLQMISTFLDPLDVSQESLGLEAMREVGPGGHYFGAEHTQSRYKTAFYSPLISDWRNFESWREAGSPTAMEKASRLWKETLARYQRPPMDPAIEEELDAFVTRRKAEGGIKTDF